MPASEATWEPVEAFKESFPAFKLEDELFVEGGRDVVYTYSRRSRTRGLSSDATQIVGASRLQTSFSTVC
jgi:hypothetical protein